MDGLIITNSPSPRIVAYLHRPTLIPRVVDVSTMLAKRGSSSILLTIISVSNFY